MKETQYFSHNYNARNDGKLELLMMNKGLAGIGAYWCILEMLYEENGYLMRSQCVRIAFVLRVDIDFISEVIFDYNLFEFDDDKFWSKSALERISMRNEKSDKARASAENRWKKNLSNANALRQEYDRNAINKTKGKEIKEKETQVPVRVFSFLLDFWEPYPKKTNQLLSEDLFAQLTSTESQELSVALPQFLSYWQGIEARFVPAPDKFLANKKWRDQLPVSFTKKVVSRVQKAENIEATEKQEKYNAEQKQESEAIWQYFLSLDDEYRSNIESKMAQYFPSVQNPELLIKNRIIIELRDDYLTHKTK